MRRCTRCWRCTRWMRALRFLSYGTGCSCVRVGRAHCACGYRELTRKAACLCCLRPAPASYADLGALQALLAQGDRAPAVVVVACVAPAPAIEATVSAAHRATHHLLGVLQGVLGDDRLAHSRVVVVTRRAVATHGGEDVLDLARAPLWGLVRA